MRDRLQTGFSLLELMVVMFIIFTIAAFAIPKFMLSVHGFRMRAAVADTSGVIQQARIRAINDNRFYSIYTLPQSGNGVKEVFADIYPKKVNGASGSGGTHVDPQDPQVTIPPEIVEQPSTSAPNIATLQSSFLPANSPILPLDGSLAASPVTFGPDGLPCAPTAVAGGTLCNSRGTATAYWIFFQNTINENWTAITVTPAGRIQKWAYSANWTNL